MQRPLDHPTLPPVRRAGVCLHLTSLPGNYGIGEIGRSALQFIDALASMNLSVWQFLPTGPTAYGDSPYQPLSSFAGNEMLIDVESLVQLNLLKSGDVEQLAELPRHTVDYGRVIPMKNALLAAAAEQFAARANAALKSQFEEFVDSYDGTWLHDYALYRVLKNDHGQEPWPQWEKPFARRQRAALKKIALDARERLDTVKILQFLYHYQWRRLRDYASEMGVQLFGDMPIYVALDSADAWASPENLQISRSGSLNYVAGVPPDYFSKNGQLWGNPLHDWETQARDGFSWWISRLRYSLSQADLVRIDHFRGFESYWSVPVAAATARKGRWETGPGKALFEALRAALDELPIIAEDLGEITAPVEALRDHYKIPGMKVLQFEVMRDDFDVSDIVENSVCYTATHDNDTTVGWFRRWPQNKGNKKRFASMRQRVLELTNGTPETIHRDLTALACASKARLAIAPMQDLLGLGSEARLNTPGKTGNNWRWRLLQEQLTPELRDSVREVTISGRRHSGA